MNLRVQLLQKNIGALTAQSELLQREVEEKRHALARGTDFSQVEPRVRELGLRAVSSRQVVSLETGEAASAERDAASDLAERILDGVAAAVQAAPAQAEEPRTGGRR